MLLRMYLRWAARARLRDRARRGEPGRGGGYQVRHLHGQGRLRLRPDQGRARRAPAGSHLAVRQAHRRHTAFAQVDRRAAARRRRASVEIDESDLRIDTYRASGAGGQHVNMTDSAVRITHLPTGIVVPVPERALADLQQGDGDADPALAARRAGRGGARGGARARSAAAKQDVGFGSQIRSLRAAPYQLVKDQRTDYETGNMQAVLDGDLDGFVRAYLLQRAAEHGAA